MFSFGAKGSRSTKIKELKEEYKQLRDLDNDGSKLEILFETSSRQYCTLLVYLDKQFPNSAPGILLLVYAPIYY